MALPWSNRARGPVHSNALEIWGQEAVCSSGADPELVAGPSCALHWAVQAQCRGPQVFQEPTKWPDA